MSVTGGIHHAARVCKTAGLVKGRGEVGERVNFKGGSAFHILL